MGSHKVAFWTVFIGVLGLLATVARAHASKPSFSISLNLTGWSPMMETSRWSLNTTTGAITSSNTTWQNGGSYLLMMVGTKYQPFGTVQDLSPGVDRPEGTISYRQGSVWARLLEPYPGVGPLARPDEIMLSTYVIYISPRTNTTVTVNYIIVEMPIATNAPNEQAFWAGAQTLPAVEGGTVNRALSIRQFASHEYTQLLSATGEDIPPITPAKASISSEGALMLELWTEVVYDVPPHTSLINITGPVSMDTHSCYARLEPEPWWWSSSMPMTHPMKPTYRANQALLVLPLDPAKEYKLIIGAMGHACAISGIMTYSHAPPQHESNSTEHAAHESKAPEPSDVPAAKSSAENSKKANAGTIAGAVVGSVAGAVLLALLVFFLARRRRPPTSPVNAQKPPSLAPHFEPTEEVQVVVPYGTASRPSTTRARPRHSTC